MGITEGERRLPHIILNYLRYKAIDAPLGAIDPACETEWRKQSRDVMSLHACAGKRQTRRENLYEAGFRFDELSHFRIGARNSSPARVIVEISVLAVI